MSNYRAGLAIANEHTTIDAMPGRILAPEDERWWRGFIPFLTERYDTPEIEKKAAQAGFVPMFLYWQGEDVFHQFGKERNDLRNAFYRSELPAHHPIHSYQYPPDDAVGFSPESDPFLSYGGDYWLNELCRNRAFWEGLHKAGTRGVFVTEIGCEHGVEFGGFNYEVSGAAWPAWFLIVADLRNEDGFTLERVYPRKELIASAGDEEEIGDTLHFYAQFPGRMIKEAMDNPNREAITAKELYRPEEPWYVH